MPKKPFSSERIVTKLRQIEVLIMQGTTARPSRSVHGCQDIGAATLGAG